MSVTGDNGDPFGSEQLYKMMREYNDHIYGNAPNQSEESDATSEACSEQEPSSSERGVFSRLGAKVLSVAVVCLVMLFIAAPALIKFLTFLIDFAIVVGAACLACWGIRRAIEAIESRNAKKAQEAHEARTNAPQDDENDPASRC